MPQNRPALPIPTGAWPCLADTCCTAGANRRRMSLGMDTECTSCVVGWGAYSHTAIVWILYAECSYSENRAPFRTVVLKLCRCLIALFAAACAPLALLLGSVGSMDEKGCFRL